MPAPDGFRTLARVLAEADAKTATVTEDPKLDPGDPLGNGDGGACELAQSEMLRELRLFRARIVEGVESAIETVITDIAADVLGRELQLAPAQLSSVVTRAVQRYLTEEPLRVRVNPQDARALSCGLPVVGDDRLRRGDALIELRSGTVDASLGVRLASILQGMTA